MEELNSKKIILNYHSVPHTVECDRFGASPKNEIFFIEYKDKSILDNNQERWTCITYQNGIPKKITLYDFDYYKLLGFPIIDLPLSLLPDEIDVVKSDENIDDFDLTLEAIQNKLNEFKNIKEEPLRGLNLYMITSFDSRDELGFVDISDNLSEDKDEYKVSFFKRSKELERIAKKELANSNKNDINTIYLENEMINVYYLKTKSPSLISGISSADVISIISRSTREKALNLGINGQAPLSIETYLEKEHVKTM